MRGEARVHDEHGLCADGAGMSADDVVHHPLVDIEILAAWDRAEVGGRRGLGGGEGCVGSRGGSSASMHVARADGEWAVNGLRMRGRWDRAGGRRRRARWGWGGWGRGGRRKRGARSAGRMGS